MHIIRKVIRKIVKNHQNIENLKFIKSAFKIPNALKRKNYMGINLTGLIQGKMETGLGFRSSIVKITYSNIKDEELKNIINKIFLQYETKDIKIYKINTNGFGWKDYGIENYQNIYLISNLDQKKYFYIIEK